MCGLWGVVGDGLDRNDIDCFKDLGIISALRGLDSTGIVAVSRGKKNRFNIHYKKDATDPINFLFWSKEVSAVLNDSHKKFALLGHTRAATIGDVTKDNAHPFHKGSIVGMHNGTITNLGNKNKTDSEELYELIAEKGVERAIKELDSDDPAYALVWVDGKKETLNFLRNYKRPLYYMISKGRGLMFYASEKEFLDLINIRSSKIFDKPEMVAADTWFEMNLGTLKMHKTEVRKPFAAAPFRPQHSGWWTRTPPALPPPPKPINDDGGVRRDTVGPDTVLIHEPPLAVRDAVPAMTVPYKTEALKFDPACDVFPQKPHTGYPFKVQLRDPDGMPTQFFKILRFNSFDGKFLSPVDAKILLDQGCIISGIKHTLDDEVYWIAPGIYVHRMYKNDGGFVKESLQIYNKTSPVLGRACYASAAGLGAYQRSLKAREVNCG